LQVAEKHAVLGDMELGIFLASLFLMCLSHVAALRQKRLFIHCSGWSKILAQSSYSD